MRKTLKQVRQKYNMNMKDFSGFLGIPYGTYRRKEIGERKLNAEELVIICKKCKLKAEDIKL